MSLTITLSGTSSLLRATHEPPIELPGEGWMIGMVDFHTFNSIPNVDEYNNVIKVGKLQLEIPSGNYEVNDIFEYLNTVLKSKLKQPNDVIVWKGNLNTLRVELICEFVIDFSHENSIGPLLGFGHKELEPGIPHISDQMVDIVRHHDIRIDCNVATGSFINGRSGHQIYAFAPDVEPGYRLIQRPSTIIYYPITRNIISEIQVRVTDQENRLLNFRGEEITIRLHLKQDK